MTRIGFLCSVGLLIAILAVGTHWQRAVVWDSASWAFMARCWLTEGRAPYRDLYDLKWPLLYAQQAAAFWALGPSLWALRMVEVIWLAIGAMGLILCVWRRSVGSLLLGIGTAWVWAVTILLPVFALGGAFSEEYTTAAALGTMGLALHGWPLLAGIVLGLGVLIKPIALVVLVPLVILTDWPRALRVGVVAALVTLAGLGWARLAIGPETCTWIFGHLARHTGWDQPGTAWPSRAQVLTVWRQTWDVAWWLWLAPLGLLAMAKAGREVIAWALWLAAEILTVTIQTVPVNHRWIPTVAPAVLLICLLARTHQWAWVPMVLGVAGLCYSVAWRPAVWAQQWAALPARATVPLGGASTSAILTVLHDAGISPGDAVYIYPWRAELGAIYFDGGWCPRTGFTAPGDGWRLYNPAQHQRELEAQPPEWMVALNMTPEHPDWLNQYTQQRYALVHTGTANGGPVRVMRKQP